MTPPPSEWPETLQLPDGEVLRALIDACPSRVSLVTPDHHYLYANPEFLKFIGLPLPRLIGRSARQVLGEEVYAAFAATARRVEPGIRHAGRAGLPSPMARSVTLKCRWCPMPRMAMRWRRFSSLRVT